MPTDTEDPNIATLREALTHWYTRTGFEAGCAERAAAALDALASTLAELRERLNGHSPDAVEAPPAPAPLALAPSLDEAFKATTELRARLDSGEDL